MYKLPFDPKYKSYKLKTTFIFLHQRKIFSEKFTIPKNDIKSI